MQPQPNPTASQNTESLLTIKDVCQITRLGKTKIWSFVSDGTLDVVRLGARCTRVKRSSVDRLISGGTA